MHYIYVCVCIYIYIIPHNDELCEDNKQGNMIVTRVREWKLPSGLVQICLFEELKSTYGEETIMGRSELWGLGEEGDREEGQKKGRLSGAEESDLILVQQELLGAWYMAKV